MNFAKSGSAHYPVAHLFRVGVPRCTRGHGVANRERNRVFGVACGELAKRAGIRRELRADDLKSASLLQQPAPADEQGTHDGVPQLRHGADRFGHCGSSYHKDRPGAPHDGRSVKVRSPVSMLSSATNWPGPPTASSRRPVDAVPDRNYPFQDDDEVVSEVAFSKEHISRRGRTNDPARAMQELPGRRTTG
jgi:hypothetical protein